jgi:aspartate kinase
VPDRPGVAARLFGPIAARQHRRRHDHPERQRRRDDGPHLHRAARRLREGAALLEQIGAQHRAPGVAGQLDVAKVSIVGLGMRTHAGIAARMFEVLRRRASTCR